jgi:hypothetical protein
MFFKRQKIEGIFELSRCRRSLLARSGSPTGAGRRSSTRSFVPPFVGAEVVETWGLENPKGFIEGARGHCERASCRLGLTRVLVLRAGDVAKSRPVAGAAARRPMG